MKARELGYNDLADFYLKSTVKSCSVVIHHQNIEPGAAEALSKLFGVELTQSDTVELCVIKMRSVKEAEHLCKKAGETYSFCCFEIWDKGKRLGSWPKK